MPLFGKKGGPDDKNKPATTDGKAAEMLDGIPEPDVPPTTDPRLPLNARQVYRLKTNWKGIKRNMQPTGTEMFIR